VSTAKGPKTYVLPPVFVDITLVLPSLSQLFQKNLRST